MKIKKNNNQIAIVVVGYNRLSSIKRLLQSLLNAKYPNNNIPLVISIDCSGDTELYEYVRNFQWNYGPKYVNIQEERLGLKKHIFKCFSLTEYFKGVILLEDDIFVSPYFYKYAQCTIEKYGDDDRIGEISLYEHEENGFVGIPFSPVQNGSDVYLAQHVSSWGECLTFQMWIKFWEWYKIHENDDYSSFDIPLQVKKYTRAWSKYYNAYLFQTGRTVIYPYISLTTNFSDAGEHGGTNNSIVQVSLLEGEKEYYLKNFEELVSYDPFSQNNEIPEWLGLSGEVVVDFYGMKESYNKPYILCPFKLPYPVVRSYAMSMRPWELNIKYNIEGNTIFLYERSSQSQIPHRRYSYDIHKYYLRRYNIISLFRFSLCEGFRKVIKKIFMNK